MFKVSFSLEVKGQKLDPDALHKIINMKFVKIQRIGEKSKSNRVYKTNSFCLSTIPEELNDFSIQFHNFIQKFKFKNDEIKKYVCAHEVDILIKAEIRSWVYENPAIFVNPEEINTLSDLGCRFIIKLKGKA